MTTSLRAALFDEPLQIALDQPHQIAISAGSVAMMAGFAGSVGIVHPAIGLVIAIGIEWAWLRGVASDVARPSGWGVTLNASAFLLAATWGVLWCAKLLKAFEPTDYGWLLAIIHVVPVVWLSLCSAMCHRIKIQEDYKAAEIRRAEEAETERARRAMELAAEQRRRDAEIALQIEDAQKRAELERWIDGKRALQAMKATQAGQPKRVTQPFTPGQVGCKHCGSLVGFDTPSEKGVIVRLGCAGCRAKRKENRP